MKKIGLIICFLFLRTLMFSLPEISFDTMEHDFGQIKEGGGKVHYTFEFTNTGDEPLKIVKVKSAWGCTVPGWSTGEILPGKKGYVEVTFNPLNRIGSFHKSILVKTNAGDEFLKLLVFGTVIPEPGKLRTKIGNLRLNKRNVNFRIVKDTETKFDTLKIQNDTAKEMRITLKKKPPFIEVLSYPEFLEPHQRAEIILKTDTQKKKYYGHLIEDLILSTKIDSFETETKIKVIISIKEDFSYLTEKELQNSAKIVLDSTHIDLGEVKKNTVINTKIKLKNHGNSTLKVRTINHSDGIEILSYPTRISPRKTGKISLEIKPIARFAGKKFLSYITIISNDPKRPETRVELSGKIAE